MEAHTRQTDDETDLDAVDNINKQLPAEIVSMVLVTYLDADYDAVIAETVCRLWAGLLAPVRRARRRRDIWRRRWFTTPTPRARQRVAEWHQRWLVAEAARRGHLKVLKWARDQGYAWSETVCLRAAQGGHLHVLQLARANGCPWDETTCDEAAQSGHLAVLQWARANGCPCSDWTCRHAARRGHSTILQWAVTNGCPWDAGTCLTEARRHGHKEVCAWIQTIQSNGDQRLV